MTSTLRFSCVSRLPSETSPDWRLMQRCAAQDPTALRELAQRHQAPLSRFLRRLLDSPEDTEEAVLDVFLRVWQQAARFEGRSSVSTWLYRIAFNVAADRLRGRKRQPQTVLRETDTVNAEEVALNRLEREEGARQVQQALQSLRVEDRLLLVLYYTDELSYAEIRQITNYSDAVLKMRLLRARRRLRARLESLMPKEEAGENK